MLNAIQTGIFTPSTKQRLIDSFVNAVYLYEDKIILTFNYKDGSKTITLAEIEGSDLSVLGAGLKGAVALANIFCWAAALLYAQMGAKSVVISPHPL